MGERFPNNRGKPMKWRSLLLLAALPSLKRLVASANSNERTRGTAAWLSEMNRFAVGFLLIAASLVAAEDSQINRENVKSLQVAWTYRTGDAYQPKNSRATAFEATPLYIDGTL